MAPRAWRRGTPGDRRVAAAAVAASRCCCSARRRPMWWCGEWSARGTVLPPGWRHSYTTTTTSAAVAVPVFFTRLAHARPPARVPFHSTNSHTRTHCTCAAIAAAAAVAVSLSHHPSVSFVPFGQHVASSLSNVRSDRNIFVPSDVL